MTEDERKEWFAYYDALRAENERLRETILSLRAAHHSGSREEWEAAIREWIKADPDQWVMRKDVLLAVGFGEERLAGTECVLLTNAEKTALLPLLRRVAEEARREERERWEKEIGQEMPEDFKDWHQNAPEERPEVARIVLAQRRIDRDTAWEQAEKAVARERERIYDEAATVTEADWELLLRRIKGGER